MSMFDDAKRQAPPVPDNTCPIIDKIQQGIDDLISGRNAELEDVRKANEQLRESGHYWHETAKEMQDHIDGLKEEVRELEEENQQLRQQLEGRSRDAA